MSSIIIDDIGCFEMSSIIIDDICSYGLTTKITVILLAKAKGDAHCRGSAAGLPACAALSCPSGTGSLTNHCLPLVRVDFILRRVCAGLGESQYLPACPEDKRLDGERL